MNGVWIFHGESSRFASGVFTSRETAAAWIKLHSLTGVLTLYPVDVGVFDWALMEGFFQQKQAHHTSPQFIGSFTSASQEHYHFENGSEA